MFMLRRVPFPLVIAALTFGCSREASVQAPRPERTKPTFELFQTSSESPSRMPIYITPYYDSDGPSVDVGPISTELTSLTCDRAHELCERLRSEWTELPVEVMYVLSIRLYDLGEKDRAVYWFYAATYRARLLKALTLHADQRPAFDRIQAQFAFHKLAGEYINGYAYGNPEPLVVTLKSIKRDAEVIPDFQSVYPELEFVDRELWEGHNRKLAAGLDQLINYVSTNGEQIKLMRKNNGTEGKY